jgi:WD40 repeat protein
LDFFLESGVQPGLASIVRTMNIGWMSSCSVSRDGGEIAGILSNGRIHTYSGPSWHEEALFSGRQVYRGPLALSPDGRSLAVIPDDGKERVELWNTRTGRRLLELDPRLLQLKCLTFSPDGRRLIAAGTGHMRREELVVWEGIPARHP